jgi:hypothetical protein
MQIRSSRRQADSCLSPRSNAYAFHLGLLQPTKFHVGAQNGVRCSEKLNSGAGKFAAFEQDPGKGARKWAERIGMRPAIMSGENSSGALAAKPWRVQGRPLLNWSA